LGRLPSNSSVSRSKYHLPAGRSTLVLLGGGPHREDRRNCKADGAQALVMGVVPFVFGVLAVAVAVLASFTLPNPVHAYDAPGRYEVELTVSDGTDSNTTQFVLDATAMDNTAPVANAGPDATTDTGEAMVDGRESFDPDAHPGPLRHFWSGPRDVAFGDSRSPRTTVASERTGTFTLTLEVFDGELSDEDSVDVTFE
jgi:hypothetical protein